MLTESTIETGIWSLIVVIFWAALAIDPHDRGDRALENVLVVAAAILLIFSYKRVLLSRISYTLIFFFLGLHAIGAQGDVWDARKDMTPATLGALIAMGVTAIININLDKDFAKEWSASLRIKQDAPLGEDEIARLLRERRCGR